MNYKYSKFQLLQVQAVTCKGCHHYYNNEVFFFCFVGSEPVCKNALLIQSPFPEKPYEIGDLINISQILISVLITILTSFTTFP